MRGYGRKYSARLAITRHSATQCVRLCWLTMRWVTVSQASRAPDTGAHPPEVVSIPRNDWNLLALAPNRSPGTTLALVLRAGAFGEPDMVPALPSP